MNRFESKEKCSPIDASAESNLIAKNPVFLPKLSKSADQNSFSNPTCFSDLTRYSYRRLSAAGEVAEWPIAPLC